MSSNRYFITFSPATGVYAKAMKPYKKWRKTSDMSRKIEIDGYHYRVVRSVGLFNKLRMRKMLVCDESGHVVRDETITRRCFRLIMYLDYYQFNKVGIRNDSEFVINTDQHPLIPLFKDIWTRLEPIMDESLNEIMSFHLHYLEEVYRLNKEIAQISKRIISTMEELQANLWDIYPQDLIKQYIDAASINFQLKSEFEVVITEARERAGRKVSKIILSAEATDYLKHLGDEVFRITKDINAANAKAELFMDQTKKERKVDKKWSDELEGSFSVETYLHELRNVYTFEKVVQMNVESSIYENWIFSPNGTYK